MDEACSESSQRWCLLALSTTGRDKGNQTQGSGQGEDKGIRERRARVGSSVYYTVGLYVLGGRAHSDDFV